MGEAWRALYPFAPHSLAVDGGHRLHYLDEGPREGPAVLLLHGNPTWSFHFRELILALRDRYRVVAPDHLGSGLSDKPARWSYRLADHVSNLERLVEALGLESVALGVHDWGGAIGMGLAARRPDRVARLIVLNTAAFTGGRLPRRIAACRAPVLGPLAVRGLNLFARAALYLTTERGLAAAVRAGYLAPYRSWADRVGILRFVQDIPTGPAHPSWATLRAIESTLDRFEERPLLLLWGERDWCFTPWFRAEWQRRFPAAEVHAFEDAGHYVLEDAFDRIRPLVRSFLERTA